MENRTVFNDAQLHVLEMAARIKTEQGTEENVFVAGGILMRHGVLAPEPETIFEFHPDTPCCCSESKIFRIPVPGRETVRVRTPAALRDRRRLPGI